MNCVAPIDRPDMPTGRRSRANRKDPHGRLLRDLLALAGPQASVLSASSKPWASATFQGSRHEVVMHFTGDGADVRAASMAETAPDAEFGIAGHIVADVSVDGQKTGRDADGRIYGLLCLSALIVEDW